MNKPVVGSGPGPALGSRPEQGSSSAAVSSSSCSRIHSVACRMRYPLPSLRRRRDVSLAVD